MRPTLPDDTRLRALLQPLLTLRHPHLRPLLSVHRSGETLRLQYGRSGACPRACDGLSGAVHALHAAGLWVGDVPRAVGVDDRGRFLMTVGGAWDLTDPFQGHPSVTGFDLRVRWRQARDLHSLQALGTVFTACA